MSNHKHCLTQAQDDLERLLSQTKSLITVITANDQFFSMGKETLASVLWLAADRLDDIVKAYQKMVLVIEQPFSEGD